MVSFYTVVILAITACASETMETAPSGTSEVAAYSTPGGQSFEVADATPDALALVDWAFVRFETAGLPEPTVSRISFAAGAPRCEDLGGWAASGEDKAEVTVCLDISRICLRNFDDVVFTIAGRMCILHELSHLWLSQYVTEPAAEEFMDLTGARSWRDPDVPWKERGVEQAADTIAWGLLGETMEILGRPLPPCELLHDGFMILTDTAPTSRCRHPESVAPPAHSAGNASIAGLRHGSLVGRQRTLVLARPPRSAGLSPRQADRADRVRPLSVPYASCRTAGRRAVEGS